MKENRAVTTTDSFWLGKAHENQQNSFCRLLKNTGNVRKDQLCQSNF